MAQHTLAAGKRWIANLMTLGRALGYLPDDEFDVAQDDEPATPVDVAWLRSEDDRFPLFLFEVESRPGSQLGNNAMKVFAQDTRLFEKPLFHFHAVLEGGDTSNRVKNTQAMFGAFNYRIYPDAAKGLGTEMIKDILSQHRRVSDRIDIQGLAAALGADVWPELDLDQIWQHAEDCSFAVGWELGYAELALSDHAFLERLARRLEEILDAGREIPEEQYRGAVARTWAPLLNIAILAQLRPGRVSQCFDAAVRVQRQGQHRRIAPDYGRSPDYDDVVFAYSPAVWGALAAALNSPPATAWVLEQLELALGDPDRPRMAVLSALSAVWMLHVSRAGGERNRGAFKRAAEHLDAAGGVAPGVWADPPGCGGLMAALDEWTEIISTDAKPAPTWDEFGVRAVTETALHDLVPELLGLLTARQPSVTGAVVHAALQATR